MKNICIILSLTLISGQALFSQKYFTRAGKVTFTSEAPLEKIEAANEKATSVLDAASGKMEFAVLIKAFQFEKALMQEHFNENYMESSTFPKAVFKGQIVNPSAVDFSKDGIYEVKVAGDMTIHGVTKTIEVPGKIRIERGEISASSVFELTVADFNIKIPAVVRENIAKTVAVSIDLNYELLKS
ncbi:YceI family protein [Flavilitoribacter nigricans]|uniref:Polyisoprenoid-binding protein n=1 Tax=Flavilitoribacter nigricans (strain ATCC 23147 / DSM 23189 / NBRC 102662 / NCIMB 1420 / SS-2) TaxID=1122177 RepID=A0A2D0NHH9_FLAN2|nr:YceI family protein [Flavilitoribacter nigricans]PHN07954.1 polyisoprenoid-binding protein [Flavilitoribacter nigricans DSM 23189 = NBRC 102662]